MVDSKVCLLCYNMGHHVSIVRIIPVTTNSVSPIIHYCGQSADHRVPVNSGAWYAPRRISVLLV